MSITVGTNTYLSVSDADSYVEDNYVSTDTKYTSWVSLTIADKEVYLKKATKKLDRQFLRGIKAVSTQTLEFPRALKSDYRRENFPILNVYMNGDWLVETSVSQRVKDAQVEEALSMVTSGATANKRAELQAQGVKSFKLGNLSEDYGSGMTGAVGTTKLLSTEAHELMRYYTLRSVAI